METVVKLFSTQLICDLRAMSVSNGARDTLVAPRTRAALAGLVGVEAAPLLTLCSFIAGRDPFLSLVSCLLDKVILLSVLIEF